MRATAKVDVCKVDVSELAVSTIVMGPRAQPSGHVTVGPQAHGYMVTSRWGHGHMAIWSRHGGATGTWLYGRCLVLGRPEAPNVLGLFQTEGHQLPGGRRLTVRVRVREAARVRLAEGHWGRTRRGAPRVKASLRVKAELGGRFRGQGLGLGSEG